MDRVSAARGRLSQVKAELRSPRVTHPCIQCRYYALDCSHPALATFTTNPVTGSVKQTNADPDEARGVNGHCGPEGALWEARSLPGAVLVGMLRTTSGKIVLLLSSGLGLSWLFG